MKFEERLTEASRESRGGFGYSAFGTRKFSGEARKEVILSLFGGKYRNGRKHAERVCRKEDYVLCRGRSRNGANDVLYVVDRIRNAGVFGYALVGEIDFAVFIERNVF